MLSASDDGTARVWTVDASGHPAVLAHDRPVSRAAFARDAARVMTLTDPGHFDAEGPPAVRLWDLHGAGAPHPVAVIQDPRPLAAAVAPDGDGLAVAGSRALRIRRPDATWVSRAIEPDFAPRVAYSAHGRRLLAAAGNGVTILEPDDENAGEGDESTRTLDHPARVTAAVFSPDGGRVATAAEDHQVRVWRLDEPGDPVELAGHKGRIVAVAFGGGGRLVASGSHDGTVRIRPATGGDALVLEHPDRVVAAAFSADSRHLLVATGPARPEPGTAVGHPLYRGPAVGEAGTRITLAARSQIAAIHLWRLDGDGKGARRVWQETGAWVAAFAPAGHHIVTGRADGGIRVWPIEIERIVELLWSLTADCLGISLRGELLGERPAVAEQRTEHCRERLRW